MSIKDFGQKIKLFSRNIRDKFYSPEYGLKIKSDLFIVLLMILVGTASFGLGKLSAYEKQKTPITVSESVQDINSVNTNQKGIVFSAKSGTKYYYPACSGASKIKEENRVWFNTIADAIALGLTLATNCNP